MNATEELYRVIEILQQGILFKNVVVIHARAKATEQFIRRLEIENIIAVLRSEAHASEDCRFVSCHGRHIVVGPYRSLIRRTDRHTL